MANYARNVAVLALAAMAAGCTVSSPVRLSTSQAVTLPAEISLDSGKDAPHAALAFADSFAAALKARGVTVQPNATFRLNLSISAQDAAAGLTQDSGRDPKAVRWHASPRKKRWFDGCHPQRLRAVVIGGPGISANPSVHVEGELDTCKDRQAELARLAQALAQALTQR